MHGPCIDHGKANTVGMGYGYTRHKGRNVRLHRLAYCEANGLEIGDIDSMYVLHSCDNPRCINPKHLRLGTAQDNMDDKMLRGRHKCPAGSECVRSILTPQQVAAIRSRYIPRHRVHGQRAMAREYNVAQMTISDAIHNITWKELK